MAFLDLAGLSRFKSKLDVLFANKANKTDTVLETTLSRGRKSGTTVGTGSFAFGNNVEASGTYSHAQGDSSIASGDRSHAEGSSTATGYHSHAEGFNALASNYYSHAEGLEIIAADTCQNVYGRYNYPIVYRSSQPSWATNTNYNCGDVVTYNNETYVCTDKHTSQSSFNTSYFTKCSMVSSDLMSPYEIIGAGGGESTRRNIRVLRKNGSEYLAGNLYVNASSNNCLDGTKVATVDEIAKPYTISLGSITDTNGSYQNTFPVANVRDDMKPIAIEVSNPDVFHSTISVSTGDGEITVECNNMSGTSDISVTIMAAVQGGNIPSSVTSDEYNTLSARIGDLTNLATDDKTNMVNAVNEVKEDGSFIYFDSLVDFKTKLSSLNLFEHCFVSTAGEVSSAVTGYNKGMLALACRVGSSSVDIMWVTNSGGNMGSSRFNTGNQEFSTNDINGKKATVEYAGLSNSTAGSVVISTTAGQRFLVLCVGSNNNAGFSVNVTSGNVTNPFRIYGDTNVTATSGTGIVTISNTASGAVYVYVLYLTN